MHYDMEDLLEQANDIQESLGRSYGVPDELDEADLEAGKYFRYQYSQIVTPFQSWQRWNWMSRKTVHHTSPILTEFQISSTNHLWNLAR
jgi:hypothetical protein